MDDFCNCLLYSSHVRVMLLCALVTVSTASRGFYIATPHRIQQQRNTSKRTSHLKPKQILP